MLLVPIIVYITGERAVRKDHCKMYYKQGWTLCLTAGGHWRLWKINAGQVYWFGLGLLCCDWLSSHIQLNSHETICRLRTESKKHCIKSTSTNWFTFVFLSHPYSISEHYAVFFQQLLYLITFQMKICETVLLYKGCLTIFVEHFRVSSQVM